ncbi:hypothetical protein [[Mycoplasma] anseris]|uniref:Lipoprotein-associated type-17 domain-containing protein n=1 Tax=[Mycoplasma] anseris TaxID=92400 RepID=A0A2Z4NDB8_9BACT|nr:hypothetical protein [[Mycoplasma] anseris]AWX69549.1 hypothetical protein DP065_02175 [[Mycoplasma] anseris]
MKKFKIILPLTIASLAIVPIASSCTDTTKQKQDKLNQLINQVQFDVENKNEMNANSITNQQIVITNASELDIQITKLIAQKNSLEIYFDANLKSDKKIVKKNNLFVIQGFLDIKYTKEHLDQVINTITLSYPQQQETTLQDVVNDKIIFNNLNPTHYKIENLIVNKNETKNNAEISFNLKFVKPEYQDLVSDTKTLLLDNFKISNEYITSILEDVNTTIQIWDVYTGSEIYPETYTISEFAIDQGTFEYRISNPNKYIPSSLTANFKYVFDANNESFDGTNIKGKISLTYNNFTTQEKEIVLKTSFLPEIDRKFLEEFLLINIDFTDKENISIKSFKIDEPISEEIKNKMMTKITINNEVVDASNWLNKVGLHFNEIRPLQIDYDTNTIKFEATLEKTGVIGNAETENYEFSVSGFQPIEKISDADLDVFLSKLKIENRYFAEEIANNIEDIQLLYCENGQIDENSIAVDENFLLSKGITNFNKENIWTSTFNAETNSIETTINIFKQNDLNPKTLTTQIISGGPRFEDYINEINVTINNKETLMPNEVEFKNLTLALKANSNLIDTDSFITFLSIKTNLKTPEEIQNWKIGKKTLSFVFKNNITNKIYTYNKVFEGFKPFEEGNTSLDIKAKENRIVSGTLSPETIAKINELKTNQAWTTFGYVKYNTSSKTLVFGATKNTSNNNFDGIVFDEEFLQKASEKNGVLPGIQNSKNPNQKALSITQKGDKYYLVVKFSAQQIEPYWILLN